MRLSDGDRESDELSPFSRRSRRVLCIVDSTDSRNRTEREELHERGKRGWPRTFWSGHGENGGTRPVLVREVRYSIGESA